MRLVTLVGGPEGRLGVLLDNDTSVLDIPCAAQATNQNFDAFTMQALIETGGEALDGLRALIAAAPAHCRFPIETVQLLAPLPRPVQIRDCCSFEAHSSMQGKVTLPDIWYRQPIYYKCNRLSVVGPDAVVEWPSFSNIVDYELEIGIVIGKSGRDIAVADAMDHVFGLTIFNDLSARDIQMSEMAVGLGPAQGKDFDGGNVFGPCIVTLDEIADPHALEMVARVNGEEWSRGNTGTLRHSIADMVSFISKGQTLHAGEIIGTGTVGTGCGYELDRFPQRGDTIELEVECLGRLRTQIR